MAIPRLHALVALGTLGLACPVHAEDGFYVGLAFRSCGEYLTAYEAEQKDRPTSASPDKLYTGLFVSFVSVADGYLTAANIWDHSDHSVGKTTEVWGRMAWLEDWCRKYPLELFINGALFLRIYLKENGK